MYENRFSTLDLSEEFYSRESSCLKMGNAQLQLGNRVKVSGSEYWETYRCYVVSVPVCIIDNLELQNSRSWSLKIRKVCFSSTKCIFHGDHYRMTIFTDVKSKMSEKFSKEQRSWKIAKIGVRQLESKLGYELGSEGIDMGWIRFDGLRGFNYFSVTWFHWTNNIHASPSILTNDNPEWTWHSVLLELTFRWI